MKMHRSNRAKGLLLAILSSFLLLCVLPGSAQEFQTRPGTDYEFSAKLVLAAINRTKTKVIYDGSYRRIPYPMGDVPADRGVCTDVIIRSFRQLGIDLQKEVHEDMRANFSSYPKIWGLKRPDKNIDHRRVPNLQTFFKRHGKSFKVSKESGTYFPGDLVTWKLPGNLPHIGIVTDKKTDDGLRPLIVHNIGAGPQLEDMLFSYPITGVFRYHGPKKKGAE